MNRTHTRWLLGAAVAAGLAGFAWSAEKGSAEAVYRFQGPGRASPEIVSVIERYGGRLDWGPHGWIAMDSQWESGDTFQIWIMQADGSERRALTKGHPQVGPYSNGNPAWHPSGKLLAFQSADAPVTPEMQANAGWRALTNPGAGVANNVWVIEVAGGKAWKLTRLRANQGVLHPHFSHAGDKLLWAELVQGRPQKWVMKLADFSYAEKSGPRLGKILEFTPGGMAFYETHSFLPDDSGFLYSATLKENDYRNLDIYRFDLATGQATVLTDPTAGAWDEHAHPSPDGSRIIWMSSADIPQPRPGKDPLAIKTDWWLMRADGSGKQRLTFFNDPQAPEFRRSFNIASDVAWSPDGRHAMGYLQQITLSVGRGQYPGTMVQVAIP